jgi:hypothetical protein
LESKGQAAVKELLPLLNDPSPVCQMAAAEVIAVSGLPEKALPVLQRWLEDEAPWNKLYAARTLEQIAPLSYPLNEVMLKQIAYLSANIDAGGKQPAGIKYRDFNFSSFTGWALESALQKNGCSVTLSQTLSK